MNRTYLTIIVVLILLILAVTTFAFYKANLGSAVPLPPPASAPEKPAAPAPKKSEPAKKETDYQSAIRLTILSPTSGATVRNPKVVVTGQTVPRADVSVNAAELVADAKGNFTTTVTLDEGENYLYVAASDENGNLAEKEILVIYEPDQP